MTKSLMSKWNNRVKLKGSKNKNPERNDQEKKMKTKTFISKLKAESKSKFLKQKKPRRLKFLRKLPAIVRNRNALNFIAIVLQQGVSVTNHVDVPTVLTMKATLPKEMISYKRTKSIISKVLMQSKQS